MQNTNTLLAVTILAAATAQLKAHEMPERLAIDKLSTQQLQPNPAAQRIVDFWKQTGPSRSVARSTTACCPDSGT